MTTRSLCLLAALLFAPLALSAQTASTLYAESDAPVLYSSSAAPATAASAAAASAAPATAYDLPVRPFSSLAIGVNFGTFGPGFDIATPLASWLNVRGTGEFFSYSPSITQDNLNISGSIKFQNAAAVLDVFPFHNRFRISGGLSVYNNTGLTGTLTAPSGTSFKMGNTTYYSNPSNPAVGTGVFTFGGKANPRFTVGFGNMIPKKGRWTFQTELGFEYVGQPTVHYSFTGQGCTGISSAGAGLRPQATVYTGCGPIAQSDITQEQNNLQDDLKDFRFFPIFSSGVSFRFGSSH